MCSAANFVCAARGFQLSRYSSRSNHAWHTAGPVNFVGWKGVKNGDLLARARADFDLFITRDKDIDLSQLGRYVTPQFGIVLLAIPQQRGRDYAAAFASL
jgi:hypothetical protein